VEEGRTGPADPAAPGPGRAPVEAGRTRWEAQYLLLALVWGASFLFIKEALKGLPPVDVALARVACGAAVLLALLAVSGDRLPRGRSTWGHLAVVAFLSNTIPFTLIAYGETHVSSVLAGIWNATTPLWTLAVATLALPDERPTRGRVAGMLVGFAGVVVVLGPWQGLGGSALTGQIMCAGAALCYGIGFPYMRRFLAGREASGAALSAGQLTCATVQLGVATAFVGGSPHGVTPKVVAAILALGVLGTGLAYVLNFAIIRAAGATVASTVTYLIPLVSTVLGLVVLGEQVRWNEPVGAAIVLASMAASQGLVRLPRLQGRG
jgi:drug/metabolite transporter (DMT)-like permease